MSRTEAFNNALAGKITAGVSTMWCAYVFCLIALTSLPAVIRSHSLPLLVAWVAQTFLQLVLLSVIMVGQKNAVKQVDELHDTVKEHHHLLKEIHRHHFGDGDHEAS